MSTLGDVLYRAVDGSFAIDSNQRIIVGGRRTGRGYQGFGVHRHGVHFSGADGYRRQDFASGNGSV